jgi:hypothetical protein
MSKELQKSLSAEALINAVKNKFLKIPDVRSFSKEPSISLKDHLMSGLAIYAQR